MSFCLNLIRASQSDIVGRGSHRSPQSEEGKDADKEPGNETHRTGSKVIDCWLLSPPSPRSRQQAQETDANKGKAEKKITSRGRLNAPGENIPITEYIYPGEQSTFIKEFYAAKVKLEASNPQAGASTSILAGLCNTGPTHGATAINDENNSSLSISIPTR